MLLSLLNPLNSRKHWVVQNIEFRATSRPKSCRKLGKWNIQVADWNCGLQKNLRLRNCGVTVAEQLSFKSCGIVIAEVLPSSCGIAIADSKKTCACPPLHNLQLRVRIQDSWGTGGAISYVRALWLIHDGICTFVWPLTSGTSSDSVQCQILDNIRYWRRTEPTNSRNRTRPEQDNNRSCTDNIRN
jgi:hypothetical protein